MATNFPAALDNSTSLPYPSSTDDTNSPSLAEGQDNQNDAVIATQTKLGTGVSAPSGTNLLVSTGTGTSAWSKASPVGTIVGTTDTQTLTNKTLTAPTLNSPTITTPTITGSIGSIATGSITATGLITGNAGATFAGTLTLQSGGTLSLPNGVIQATALSPSAITLGYAQSVTGFDLTSFQGTPTQIPGLTTTVTIPAGGRMIKITVYAPSAVVQTGGDFVHIDLWDGAVNGGGNIQEWVTQINADGGQTAVCMIAVVSPSAGSKTYNVSLKNDSGLRDVEVLASSNSPMSILVEAI